MLIIDAVGVFFGGYVAARINKSKGLIIGLAVGLIILLSMILSGFVLTQSNVGLVTLLKTGVIIITSALGGIKGVNIKDKIKIK